MEVNTQWKVIEEYTRYSISDDGQLRNNETGLIRKQGVSKGGYLHCDLYDPILKEKNFYIHRLVAIAYIPNPENKSTVNHIDGNKANNRVDNLEWSTQLENNLHAYKTGLKNHFHNIKSISQYSLTGQLIREWPSLSEAGRQLGISTGSISCVATGKLKTSGGFIWKYQDIESSNLSQSV